MKRTFIAFDIIPSTETQAAYQNIRHKLHPNNINWVPDNNFHITINFLGDTPDEILPGLFESMRSVISDFSPFHVKLSGTGIFGNLRDPRVLWIGCRFDPVLDQIRVRFDSMLEIIGFRSESRTFSPHLTLGRIKLIRQINPFTEVLEEYKNVEFQQQTIKEIILYESRLLPSGAVYTPLHVFELGC